MAAVRPSLHPTAPFRLSREGLLPFPLPPLFAFGGRIEEMKRRHDIREVARVLWRLNGGYTTVTIGRTGGRLDLPTEVIPAHLRTIGRRFVLRLRRFAAAPGNSPDDLRDAIRVSYEACGLPDSAGAAMDQ